MEVTEEERRLLDSFRQLGVAPKADSKEDLQRWLRGYAAEAATPSSATTATLVQPPRLSCFNGHDAKGNEVGYDIWRYEIQCLQRVHAEDAVLEAVRRSARGEAARIIMRLGPAATLPVLLAKLDSIYGEAQSQENALARFYSARQQRGENVASWSCRLEDLLLHAEQLGQVSQINKDSMLRNMLWTGLLPDLKAVSGYKFDTISDYDKLRLALRRLEQEMTPSVQEKGRCAATSNMAQSSQESDRVKTLEETVKKLQAEIERLKQTKEPSQQRSRDRESRKEVPTCHRCGEKGHLKIGCRVRMDHVKPLNGNDPTPRDGW